ncbi:MAG: response regulator [Nitrospinota bacterium]|nr:MAG: response regulator [Nitrospinota bacterium]
MRRKRILLIDREKNSRQALTRLLVEDGYWVESLSSLVQALRRREEEAFDLVVVDMGIPYKIPKRRQGIQVPKTTRWQGVLSLLRILQREELTIPLIVIEARDEIRDYLRAVNLACEYLDKPIDYEELKRKIEQVLAPANSLVTSA